MKTLLVSATLVFVKCILNLKHSESRVKIVKEMFQFPDWMAICFSFQLIFVSGKMKVLETIMAKTS